MMDFLFRSLVIGGVATALLDVWNIIVNRTIGAPLPNWALVGRWVRHLPYGTFSHADMTAARGFGNELAVGWLFHYAVGVAFAAALLLLWPTWAANPTLLPPLIVGYVTIGCGWFILAPGMGGGMAHSRRDNAGRIRLLNVLGHTVFGLGLWIGGLLLKGM